MLDGKAHTIINALYIFLWKSCEVRFLFSEFVFSEHKSVALLPAASISLWGHVSYTSHCIISNPDVNLAHLGLIKAQFQAECFAKLPLTQLSGLKKPVFHGKTICIHQYISSRHVRVIWLHGDLAQYKITAIFKCTWIAFVTVDFVFFKRIPHNCMSFRSHKTWLCPGQAHPSDSQRVALVCPLCCLNNK